MHRRLREATSALHLRIEAELDLLAPDLTLQRYRRIQENVLRLLRAPRATDRRGGRSQGEDPIVRDPLRAALLRRDLAALGVPPAVLAELPRCADLPPLQRTADLAGCLYVIEGAALGGRPVSTDLEPRLGISAQRGASFFVGEGPRTGARWKAVLAWIESVAAEEGPGDPIVDAAVQMFRTLERWCKQQGDT